MIFPNVLSFIVAILAFIPFSVQQNITSDSTCTNYLINNNNNTQMPNILGIGVVNSTLFIVTPNLMVYQVPSVDIDTYQYKIYLNRTYPEMMMNLWPQLYQNQYFIRIMSRLANILFYGAVVPMTNMIYTNAAFLADFQMNPNDFAVFFNITTNGVFPSPFRFPVTINCPSGGCKVSFISTDIPQYSYALKVDSMHNIFITRLQAPGQTSMQQLKFVGSFAPICKYSDTQVVITRDIDCSRYRGQTLQKFGYVSGFVYQNQFYLIGPYYVDIFNEAIFNAMDTATTVTRIQLADFFMCNSGYVLLIVIALAVVLIIVGICLFCYCKSKNKDESKKEEKKDDKAEKKEDKKDDKNKAKAPLPSAVSSVQPDVKATTSPSKTRLSAGSSSNLLNRRSSAGAIAPSRTGSNMSNRNVSRVTSRQSKGSLKQSSKPNLNVNSKRG